MSQTTFHPDDLAELAAAADLLERIRTMRKDSWVANGVMVRSSGQASFEVVVRRPGKMTAAHELPAHQVRTHAGPMVQAMDEAIGRLIRLKQAGRLSEGVLSVRNGVALFTGRGRYRAIAAPPGIPAVLRPVPFHHEGRPTRMQDKNKLVEVEDLLRAAASVVPEGGKLVLAERRGDPVSAHAVMERERCCAILPPVWRELLAPADLVRVNGVLALRRPFAAPDIIDLRSAVALMGTP